MNKRIKASLAAGVAGAVVVGMSLLGASAALADDAPAAPTQEVTSSPDTAAPAPTETSPSSATDQPETSGPATPATSGDAPATESPADPTPPTEQTAQPDPATPDHVDSAADPIQQVASPATLSAPESAGDEWFTWRLAVDTLPANQQGHVGAKAEWFPQPPIGKGQIAAEPGTCVQQDHYKGPRKKLDALYAAPLTWNAKAGHASDNDVPGVQVLDWTITCTPPAPPVVNPHPCVPTGDWYSEDVAPVQTESGLLFAGQGAAVDWYHPVTGNLQGFTSQSATWADVSGYQPSVTLVLYRDGATGYANLVSEWYMNGGSASTDGTFTATPSSVWWTNKIASGPGSQSSPQPLAFFADLWPHNQLIAVGPHLGSAQTAETHSTLTAVSGCVSASFVPTKPEPKVTTETWQDQVCVEPANGKATVTEYGRDTTISPVWSDETHGYVDGEPVVGDAYVIETTTVDDNDCAPAVVAPPTDTPTPPATVVDTPQSPTPIASVSDDTLAHTGSDMLLAAWITAGLAALLLAAGGSLMLIRRRHAAQR